MKKLCIFMLCFAALATLSQCRRDCCRPSICERPCETRYAQPRRVYCNECNMYHDEEETVVMDDQEEVVVEKSAPVIMRARS